MSGLNDWTIDDVAEWIETLEQGRFTKHAKAFKKAKIDGKKLQNLKTDRSISQKVKIKDSKSRQKIRIHIENLLKRMKRRTKMGGKKVKGKEEKDKKDTKKRSDSLDSTDSLTKKEEKPAQKNDGLASESEDPDLEQQIAQVILPRQSSSNLLKSASKSNLGAAPAPAVNPNHPVAALQHTPAGPDDDVSTVRTEYSRPMEEERASVDFQDETQRNMNMVDVPAVPHYHEPVQYEGGLLSEQLSVVFNFLRQADAITDSGLSTGIPQILVVGRKGGGKTSVTQAITGLPLPVCPYSSVDNNIPPTLCPLHIIKRKTAHQNHFYCAVKICWLWDERSEPTRLSSPMLEQISQITDITQLFSELIRDIITAQERIMTHSNGAPVSRNEVVVEMESSDIDDINLVEIPGFSPDGDPVNQLVGEILSAYVEVDSCILSVIPATEDIRQEPIYDLIKQLDPEQAKTCGVITKLDSIEHEQHGQWVNILTGRMRPLQNGYVAVRNLSDVERQNGMSLQDALQLEYQLFHTNPDWSRIPRKDDHLGNNALLAVIRKVMSKMTWNRLPVLKNAIEKKVLETETQLHLLPPVIALDHSKQVVQHLIKCLHKEFEIQLRESTETTIYDYLQKSFQYFMMQIAKSRPYFKSDDDNSDPPAVVFTVEEVRHILDWAKAEEAKGEGKAKHRAREVFMTQISAHWVNPAMKCVEHCAGVLVKGIEHVCEKILGPFMSFRDIAKEQSVMLLEQLTQVTIEQVQGLLEQEKHPYGTADPVRLQRRADAYAGQFQKNKKASKWTEDRELLDLCTSVHGYFDIALLRFGDNVPIAIDSTMCKQFVANITTYLEEALTLKMSTNQDLHTLVLPEQHILDAAQGCRHMLENLNQALKQINSIRPDINVRLAHLNENDPIQGLKFDDKALDVLLPETLIQDLKREQMTKRAHLGAGEIDFYDIKMLREQLKGEQKQLVAERKVIETEKDKLEQDHVNRIREHKKLEEEIREMTSLIEEQREKVMNDFSSITQVRGELDTERNDFEKERLQMKEKVEEARAALIAANEQLVAEQKKLQLEKENLVHQWKHFEEQKQQGFLGEGKQSYSNESVELEKEILQQDKVALEKEWNLLAVMKHQMEETKEQLENDQGSCERIRSELTQARERFQQDAVRLKTHADQLAKAKSEQKEEAEKLERVKEELQQIQQEIEEKNRKIKLEAEVLQKLEMQVKEIVGTNKKGDFNEMVKQSLQEINRREDALDQEKNQLLELRVNIEHERAQIEEMKKMLSNQTSDLETMNNTAQENSLSEKEDIERMKAEIQKDLQRMERERHEIAKAKLELRQLQTEVATQTLESSLKSFHEKNPSMGAIKFADEAAVKNTLFTRKKKKVGAEEDVKLHEIYQKNVTLSTMLNTARKEREKLITQSDAKTNHVKKQKEAAAPTHRKQNSYQISAEDLVKQALVEEKSTVEEKEEADKPQHQRENSLAGVKTDLSTLIGQMQSALNKLEEEPDILQNSEEEEVESPYAQYRRLLKSRSPSHYARRSRRSVHKSRPSLTEEARAAMESERNSFRTALKRLSSRSSVAKGRPSIEENLQRLGLTKLQIPREDKFLPRHSYDERLLGMDPEQILHRLSEQKVSLFSTNEDGDDIGLDHGLDSLLSHLEGELDNLVGKKENPFDLISPKYKPNQNLGLLRERTMSNVFGLSSEPDGRERTMSTIFRTEDLLPMTDSLIQINSPIAKLDEDFEADDTTEAKAEEVLQRMIDNITQMQQTETEVLQAMEAFERHHSTKASIGGWADDMF